MLDGPFGRRTEEVKDFPEMVTDILKEIGRDVDTPHLYHYTDGQSLKSIIETGQLWLTERNYMNDILDGTFVKDEIQKKLSGRKDFSGSILESEMFAERAQYVFSTSLEKDLAHQWSNYGNSDAYCLEFSRVELREFFLKSKEDADQLYYGPILYDTNDVSTVCDRIIRDMTEGITNATNPSSDPLSRMDLYERSKKVYQYFYSLIKQRGHYAEKEFRFLVQSTRKPEYLVKGGLFVPFIKIGKKRRKLPISRVYVGPSNHDRLAIESLKSYLKQGKYKGVGVEPSELKTRKK